VCVLFVEIACIGVNANLELMDKFCYLGDMLSVDGDGDTAVETRILTGWNKFPQLVPLLTKKDISLIVRGRLYSSCVRSNMLHGSETWPIRRENEVALQRQRWEFLDGYVALSYKIEFQVKGWETRIEWHNLGTTAKTGCNGMGMCCEKKTMLGWRNGVWSWRCQAKR